MKPQEITCQLQGHIDSGSPGLDPTCPNGFSAGLHLLWEHGREALSPGRFELYVLDVPVSGGMTDWGPWELRKISTWLLSTGPCGRFCQRSTWGRASEVLDEQL